MKQRESGMQTNITRGKAATLVAYDAKRPHGISVARWNAITLQVTNNELK